MSFNGKYLKELVNQFMMLHPDEDRNVVVERAKKLCKERMINPSAKLNTKDTNLSSIVKYIEKNKPILTGYGTMFMQHAEKKSVEYELVKDLKVMRDVHKKAKWEHLYDEDKTIYNISDTSQLTYKLLNNSFFGAENEPNSFFYHPLMGPSITQTGVVIITTSINLFEKAVTSNIFFRSFTDVVTYVYNIINNEDYDIFKYVSRVPSIKEVTDFIFDRMETMTAYNRNRVEELISILSEEDRSKVFYKNNFYAFMDDSIEFTNILETLIGNDKFTDPNKPPEEYIERLDTLWEIFDTVIHYNYMDFYRMENAKYKKRKTILTCDTDSNFLYLFPFYLYCFYLSDNMEDTHDNRYITLNIMMYILTKLIAKCYNSLTTKCGIEDEEERNLISMKNEIFYSRILLTESKKNYSGTIYAKEGKILDKPSHDIKGLAIKKVNTNKEVRKEYTKILNDKILNADEISLVAIYREYNELKERIETSIITGSSEFFIPGKVNEVENYVNPFQQQTVRGSLLWNELYPNNPIIFPDKINYVKLKKLTFVETCKVIYECEDIDGEEKERIVDVVNKVVFSDEVFRHYGMTIICCPKSIKQLPSWIIPLIFVDKVIEENLSPGYKILKSIKSNVLSYSKDGIKREIMTNIINI